MRRYVRQWKHHNQAGATSAFIPLVFDPGEAFQFDWSYESLEIGGVPIHVKVAHFQNLASHYLLEPVTCTPAAGWEKGQVENQAGVIRQRFFSQRRRFADLEELNGWLSEQCRHHAATQKHPDDRQRTFAEAFPENGFWMQWETSAFTGPFAMIKTAIFSVDSPFSLRCQGTRQRFQKKQGRFHYRIGPITFPGANQYTACPSLFCR